MSKFRLQQVQLVVGVSFSGALTASLVDSQAAALYYDSDLELVCARGRRDGAPMLMIPQSNVVFMSEYVEPPPAKPAPAAPPPAPAPKSDVIKAIAPGVTQKVK